MKTLTVLFTFLALGGCNPNEPSMQQSPDDGTVIPATASDCIPDYTPGTSSYWGGRNSDGTYNEFEFAPNFTLAGQMWDDWIPYLVKRNWAGWNSTSKTGVQPRASSCDIVYPWGAANSGHCHGWKGAFYTTGQYGQLMVEDFDYSAWVMECWVTDYSSNFTSWQPIDCGMMAVAQSWGWYGGWRTDLSGSICPNILGW